MPAIVRTDAQIRRHYELECRLAQRLRSATPQERRALYDELFRSLPDHPQLLAKARRSADAPACAYQLRDLRPFLRPDMVFLELGPGDCALSFAVAPLVRQVIGVEISREITSSLRFPDNFELRLSTGTDIPVPPGSVDLVYSHQLMEHLHPDDAHEQLIGIHQALRPGGLYFCVTPNRQNGPHDVSRYYDEEAHGMHLREYTIGELARLFRRTGFRKVRQYLRAGEIRLELPSAPLVLLERLLQPLPHAVRRALASGKPLRPLLFIKMIAVK